MIRISYFLFILIFFLHRIFLALITFCTFNILQGDLCSPNAHIRRIKVRVNFFVEILWWTHSGCQQLIPHFPSQGTGVVTSVPSDSPDDFAALRDLKKKQVSFCVSCSHFLFLRPHLLGTTELLDQAEKLCRYLFLMLSLTCFLIFICFPVT